ncbi:hypothetical protein NMY22_g2653 [Coprinellus aureogranulatus]|nr:hypothetical protein NMY22_g2653 [Coprinellus aureogranulatus]
MGVVSIVTTKWDRLVDLEEGKRRVEELKSDFWDEILRPGAPVWHVQPPAIAELITTDHRNPWDMVHDIVSKRAASLRTERNGHSLQIQDEIVHRKLFLPQTDAGRELHITLEDLVATAKELKRQMDTGKPDPVLQTRQEEIESLTAEMKAMRYPAFIIKLMRFIGMRPGESNDYYCLARREQSSTTGTGIHYLPVKRATFNPKTLRIVPISDEAIGAASCFQLPSSWNVIQSDPLSYCIICTQAGTPCPQTRKAVPGPVRINVGFDLRVIVPPFHFNRELTLTESDSNSAQALPMLSSPLVERGSFNLNA